MRNNLVIIFMAAALIMAFSANPAWAGELALGGAVELDAVMYDLDGTTGNDIVTSTVELDANAKVDEGVEAEVILLYEEDATDPINVDTATITYNLNEAAYFTGGMTVPPFGNYNTFMLSDPVTLAVGETAQSIAAIGYSAGGIGFEVGAFNGDVAELSDTEDTVNAYYAAVSYDSGSGITAGASWISSIADSDGLQGEITNASGAIDSLVSGYSAYVVAEFGQFSVGAEYIAAAGEFEAGEMGFAVDKNGVAKACTPMAYTIEAAFKANDALTVAARYEGSSDLYSFAPESAFGVAASYALKENTTLAAEYLSGTYADNFAGVEEASITTVELAVSF